jgi:hypothetical protein
MRFIRQWPTRNGPKNEEQPNSRLLSEEKRLKLRNVAAKLALLYSSLKNSSAEAFDRRFRGGGWVN